MNTDASRKHVHDNISDCGRQTANVVYDECFENNTLLWQLGCMLNFVTSKWSNVLSIHGTGMPKQWYFFLNERLQFLYCLIFFKVKLTIKSWLCAGINSHFRRTNGCFCESVKVLRQKMSRPEGDSNPQPQIHAECYQGQTFAVLCFGTLTLAVKMPIFLNKIRYNSRLISKLISSL